MLLKSLGIILLLFGSLYLCFAFSLFEKRRLEQAEGILLLLRHTRAQISCFQAPLGKIYGSFSCQELERAGFLEALRETESIASAIEQAKEQLYLTEEQKALLLSFAGEVGGSFKEEQIAACDYYISQWENGYAMQKNALPNRQKLYRSLFITAGLMLAILLV